ncbi:MAG: hypothetical protein K9N11_09890 [Lentisphaeria bacterium]|nr:hypothetical protein [Candidatus Neomarinimicrobiota bacterium]MCF7843143.1 hypothetical protein [Lentisphaeria bacterium]
MGTPISGNIRTKSNNQALQHLIGIVLFPSLLLVMLARCDEPGYTQFIIEIDSLVHPDTVMVLQQVEIEFYGVVGPDGCHKFKTIQVEPLSDSLLQFTVWGERPDYQTICPDVIVYLEGETYTMSVDKPGWQHIRVKQPDGSIFRDSLFVIQATQW